MMNLMGARREDQSVPLEKPYERMHPLRMRPFVKQVRQECSRCKAGQRPGEEEACASSSWKLVLDRNEENRHEQKRARPILLEHPVLRDEGRIAVMFAERADHDSSDQGCLLTEKCVAVPVDHSGQEVRREVADEQSRQNHGNRNELESIQGAAHKQYEQNNARCQRQPLEPGDDIGLPALGCVARSSPGVCSLLFQLATPRLLYPSLRPGAMLK